MSLVRLFDPRLFLSTDYRFSVPYLYSVMYAKFKFGCFFKKWICMIAFLNIRLTHFFKKYACTQHVLFSGSHVFMSSNVISDLLAKLSDIFGLGACRSIDGTLSPLWGNQSKFCHRANGLLGCSCSLGIVRHCLLILSQIYAAVVTNVPGPSWSNCLWLRLFITLGLVFNIFIMGMWGSAYILCMYNSTTF